MRIRQTQVSGVLLEVPNFLKNGYNFICSLEPGPFEVNILGPGKIEPIP